MYAGGNYAWEFKRGDWEFSVRVVGQLAFNMIMPVLQAATDGLALAYVPQELAAPFLADGRSREVLADWCPTFQGYHSTIPAEGTRRRHSRHLLRRSVSGVPNEVHLSVERDFGR